MLEWPVAGRIASGFGMRSGRMHHGIDVVAQSGTPIAAADGGLVTFSGLLSELGRTTVIDHGGGLETVYSHQSACTCRVGQWVRRGQRIGRVGSTGRSTGPHLHFEVRVHGERCDPFRYLTPLGQIALNGDSDHAPDQPGCLPFVSVVIPTRNRSAMLEDCLQSLLAQDYPADRYEIIVIDDGSSDGTATTVAAIAGRSIGPRVHYLRIPPSGVNAARNAGLSHAGGDPICFVDDDVEAPPSWLGAMVAGAQRHPDAGCLGGPIRLRLEGATPRLCGREPLGETELDLGSVDKETTLLYGTNLAARRQAIRDAGGFRSDLSGPGDEREWQYRLRAKHGTVMYIADAWLWHRRVAEDLTLVRLAQRRFDRGVRWAKVRAREGTPAHFRGLSWMALRQVAHVLLYRCTGSIPHLTDTLGKAWGGLIYQTFPRVRPPSRSDQLNLSPDAVDRAHSASFEAARWSNGERTSRMPNRHPGVATVSGHHEPEGEQAAGSPWSESIDAHSRRRPPCV